MYKQEVEDLKAEFSRADFIAKVKFLVVVNVHHLGLDICFNEYNYHNSLQAHLRGNWPLLIFLILSWFWIGILVCWDGKNCFVVVWLKLVMEKALFRKFQCS